MVWQPRLQSTSSTWTPKKRNAPRVSTRFREARADALDAVCALVDAVDHDDVPYVEVAQGHSKRAVREAGLVLQAAGVEHVIESSPRGGARVFVPRADEALARKELNSYANENVGWPPAKLGAPPKLSSGVIGALAYGLVIAVVFWIERHATFGLDWRETGVMHAGSVRGGEAWRTVTALTMHVDFNHLLSNLVFGGLFGVVAAQTLGSGLTWFGTLLAGAGGNALEVLLVDPSHRAVGASTAIFGALGLMVAAEWTRRGERKLPWVRRVAPLFAGAVLFGWFGGGGSEPSRVDVLAHATGFVVGTLVGVVIGRFKLSQRVTPAGQACLAALTLLIVAAAWTIGFLARR